MTFILQFVFRNPAISIPMFYTVTWIGIVPLAVASLAAVRWAGDPTHRTALEGPWFFFENEMARRMRRWRWFQPISLVLIPSVPAVTLYREWVAQSPAAEGLILIGFFWPAALSWTWVVVSCARSGVLFAIRGREKLGPFLAAAWVYGFVFFIMFSLLYSYIAARISFPFVGERGQRIDITVPYLMLGCPMPALVARWCEARASRRIKRAGGGVVSLRG